MLFLLIFLALCWPSLADDMQLDSLRSTLIGLRGKQPGPDAPRGATPQLTVAKHQLRDWVESRLDKFAQRGDVGEFERRLNSELREARLSCGATGLETCPDWTFSGFLEDLKIRRLGGFLFVQSGVGIECGFDESAYLYSWSGEGWSRVWQTEQNTYTKKDYQPQTLH